MTRSIFPVVALLLLTSVAAAAQDHTPALPVVIPRPKQMKAAAQPFRLNNNTRIVIGNNADVNDKVGAELLRRELRERWKTDVGLLRARDVEMPARNLIVIGEPGHNPVLDRLLAVHHLTPPAQPEGYVVLVAPRAALIVGRDRAGALWGAQTLMQLIARDGDGVFLSPVQISDWPSFAFRGVHLFHGKDALPFHEKLIDRVLSRYKMNALVLQVEQLGWDTTKSVAPTWAGRKQDIAAEIQFARRRGIRTYPLIQAAGHMEWLFANKQNLEFAEDPEKPAALNVTNPAAVRLMDRLIGEADDLFNAPGFHVGMDEVVGFDERTRQARGRYPYRSLPKTFVELFLQNARHWHDFLNKRGVRMWMWADMGLYRDDVAPSFGTAPSPEEAEQIRIGLLKDIVLVDWQYSARDSYPSLDRLKSAGFDTIVGATWYYPDGIQQFSRAAKEQQIYGMLQTTWAGYESKEAVLETDAKKQFVAFVLAAEYFWNGGDGPAPDQLPYRAEEIFTRAMQ